MPLVKSIKNRILCVIAFAVATITLPLLQWAGAAAMPLKSEFSVKLSYPLKGLEWSPDGRYVALPQDVSYRVLLLNIDKREVVDKAIAWKARLLPALSWSADSASLVVIGYELALVSLVDGRDIKRAKIPTNLCDNRRVRRAVSMSADGLWLACAPIRKEESYAAAEAFSIPHFEPKQLVEGAVPKIGFANTVRTSRIDRFVNDSFLTVLFDTCVLNNQLDGLGCAQYASCIKLEARESCFKTFLLDSDGTGREPVDVALLVERKLVVSQWRPTESGRNGPFDFAFEINDFEGRRLARLGFHDERRELDVRDFQVTSKGLLIVALADEPKNKGGIAVWSVGTGMLLQFIPTPPAAFVKLSADETRLAVTADKQVFIFSISSI